MSLNAAPVNLDLQLPSCGPSQHRQGPLILMRVHKGSLQLLGIYLLGIIYCGNMRWMVREGQNKLTFLACLNVFEFLLVRAKMSIIYFSVLQCLWLLCHLKVIYNNYIRKQSAIN